MIETEAANQRAVKTYSVFSSEISLFRTFFEENF